MKIKLGIIGGSNISELLEEPRYMAIKTPYGKPSEKLEIGNLENKKVAFLQRHGKARKYPPHRINHKANLWALKKIGVEKIISVTSVGSLKKEIETHAIFIPNDFLCLWHVTTYYDKEIVHITPELDYALRKILTREAKKCNLKVFEGIYAQTLGPRLETRAEINLLKDYADVVGMNLASEATLANELNLRIANLSSVDNYAHGIIEQELSFEKILENARKNAENLIRVLRRIVKVV
jgi:5'-methylthioadenosine phosphorylase